MGGDVSDRSRGPISGQHLRARYYAKAGELIQARFFDASGKKEGSVTTCESTTLLSLLKGAREEAGVYRPGKIGLSLPRAEACSNRMIAFSFTINAWSKLFTVGHTCLGTM